MVKLQLNNVREIGMPPVHRGSPGIWVFQLGM